MSWFTDLAGKAEAFLDRMDQATASTLQDAGIVKGTPKSSTSMVTQSYTARDTSHSPTPVAHSLSYEPTASRRSSNPSSEKGQGATVAHVIVGSASDSPHRLKPKPSGPALSEPMSRKELPKSSESSGLTRTSSLSGLTTGAKATPKVKTEESDEMLFEFLNTPSSAKSLSSAKTVRSTPKPKTSVGSSGVGLEGQQLDQVSNLPGPQLSPVKAQPSFSLAAMANGERSQWDVGNMMSSSKSGHSKESYTRESKSSIAVGIKEEQTDGPFAMKVIATNPQSEGRDSIVPLDTKNDVNEKHKQDDIIESQSAPTGEGEGQNQAQNDVDKTLLAENDTLRQKVSNLELENKLLKREIASLNDEMGSLMTRLNEVQDSGSRYDREIQSLREQASQSDHVIRQLRSQDDDLQAHLDARDKQIAILRSQLAEGDRRAEQLREDVSCAQREKEQLLQDANLSSDAQNQALETLKSKLNQAEALLHEQREQMEAARWDSAQKESQLQAEKTQLSEALASQQKQLSFQQMKLAESQSAVRSVQNDNQLLRKEYEDYKQRAAGILQTKEKLIASLQGGEGTGSAVSEAQLEEMRLEKEHVQAQLHSARQQIEACKAAMQESEERYHGEVDSLSEQLHVCESILTEEKRLHTAAQQEVLRLKQELEAFRDDSLQEKSSMLEQIKEKDSELSSLKAKLHSASPDKAELESRLRELTESLIQKQTTLETLNSERHSLNLQMQRLQAQLNDAQQLQTTRADTAVVMNGLEASSHDTSRIRPISSVLTSLDEAPTESRLHNVKRAVNTVDRFSIRLGVFLRRYPHARLFALLYVVLLHIWVMVVLLTYTPEAHNPSDPKFLHDQT